MSVARGHYPEELSETGKDVPSPVRQWGGAWGEW